MAPIGFSTGTLARTDFRLGIQLLKDKPAVAIELSALRESELAPLLSNLDELDLSQFSYVSFHAPSNLEDLSERALVESLQVCADREWPIVVHPDIIEKAGEWQRLGSYLCIENMDKRKSTGRTTEELESIFNLLPEASFCFDLGHARQIDPTMHEGQRMLARFSEKLRQIHLSEVNSDSKHEPLSFEAIHAFKRLAYLIPPNVPIILESPVTESAIEKELDLAGSVFSG